jgi:short-subunit dehydrogenase
MDGTPSSSPLTGAVLITGASYGLGYELTRCFAGDGHALILVARSGDRLRAVAQELSQAHGVQVDTVALDLAQPDAARMLFEEIQRRGHTVEILVNNAGFGTYGRFSDIDFDAETREMQLNMLTPTQLT